MAKSSKGRVRVRAGLKRLKADVEISKPLFDYESPASEVGEMFQFVVDCIDDLGQKLVARAFDEAGLNREDPVHWGYLMQLLADGHYGQGGRPLTRDDDYKANFMSRLEELAKQRPGAKHNELFADFAKRYGGQPPFQTLHTEHAVRTTFYKIKKTVAD
jgi:hypothetical protein